MLPVERWITWYADGQTAAWGCSDTCTEHTVHVGGWAEAPPFGVICIVLYRPGNVLFMEVGADVSIYEWPGPQPTGVVEYVGTAEGCAEPVKMGLWTDGESYWRVHDLARRSVTP